MYNKSFIDACLDGEATLFALDNYIEYWHTNDTDLTLQQFLGMTDYEFEVWGKSSDSIIRDILQCRRNNINFNTYSTMNNNERLAARSYNQEAIDKLLRDNEDDE